MQLLFGHDCNVNTSSDSIYPSLYWALVIDSQLAADEVAATVADAAAARRSFSKSVTYTHYCQPRPTSLHYTVARPTVTRAYTTTRCAEYLFELHLRTPRFAPVGFHGYHGNTLDSVITTKPQRDYSQAHSIRFDATSQAVNSASFGLDTLATLELQAGELLI